MSTNKQAFKYAVVKANNFQVVFKRYRLDTMEIQKLYRYLRPLYMYFEGDYVIFKFPEPAQLEKIKKLIFN